MSQKFCNEVIACECFHVLFLLPRLSPSPPSLISPPSLVSPSSLPLLLFSSPCLLPFSLPLSPSLTSPLRFPPSSLLPPHLFTHSTLYWTALSRNGDTIWNMSLSDTNNTRPLSIPGTRKINNLTLETLGKSLYWINSMNATIERYDLQTEQLHTIAEDAANVTG